jgi:hypothetical protein
VGIVGFVGSSGVIRLVDAIIRVMRFGVVIRFFAGVLSGASRGARFGLRAVHGRTRGGLGALVSGFRTSVPVFRTVARGRPVRGRNRGR